MAEQHTYRLKDGVQRVAASDVRLARDSDDLPTTVELDEEEAAAINDSRPEPVIERAGGATDSDGGSE
jgi:hypothetical protein